MFPMWWRRHFLLAEFGLAVAVSVAFAVWALYLGGEEHINALLAENRATVYGTLASILGSLLGFVITTLALTLGFSSSNRLALLRKSRHYPTIWKVFTETIRALGLATVLSVAGLLFDRDNAPVPILLYAFTGSLLLAVLRLGRAVWILEEVVSLVTAPSKARTADDP